MRLKILCPRQDQEPGATNGSDLVFLKVSPLAAGSGHVVRGKGKDSGTDFTVKTSAKRNVLIWPSTLEPYP